MKMPFKIPDAIIDWLIRRADANPYYHLEGYMLMGWVFRLGPRHQSSRYRQSSTGWLSARIHKILRSDKDRDLHDHPQDYCSIILRGGYYEVTPIYGYGENFERFVAGARIDQRIHLDRESLDFYEAQPAGRIVINYASREEVDRIVKAGRREEASEGFLAGLQVGNS